MNCKKTTALLGRYVDNELPVVQRKDVEDHIEHCPDCKKEVQMLKGVETLVKSHDAAKAPEGYWVNFTPRLHQRILTEGIKRKSIFTLFGAPGFRYGMALTLLVLVALLALLPRLTVKDKEATRIMMPVVYVAAPEKGAREKNYLNNSEIVLIKLVSMPEEKENFERLKQEVSQGGLQEQINSNLAAFKDDPQLLNHAKAMEIITIKLNNTRDANFKEDLQMLKSQVIQSGLLEKTRALKI
jgi:hypothetical protein